MATSHRSQTNRLLGYPDDARLLLINADDFGMCHAINEAILLSMRGGVVQSTSLMTPCPWGLPAIDLLKDNPALDFGVHLTVICDQVNYKWRPLISPEKVPSLIDETGFCYPISRMAELAAKADIHELEIEFRAQIEMVLSAGLKPNHLDWHCLHSGGRAEIFDLTQGLAKEYGLALRVANQPYINQVQAQGLPTDDYDLLDSYDLDLSNKAARYAQLLRELPVGLTEWAVHPGIGNAEMRAVEPGSWQIRQTDYDFVISPEARQIIAEEGIILINYAVMQKAWQG
jgi:chitin disaccharide deacetylase